MNNALSLGEEKITSLLWKFSVPAVAGMLVTALYNVVDSIFVGQGVGTIALTAVTIAFPIMAILMAVGMLVGIGSATLISISLGEQNREHAERVLGNAVTLVVLFVLATVGLTLWFLDPILINLLGVTPEVLPYAHDFTSIILYGSVFMHVGFGLNNIIRAQGDPKTALLTQLISAVLIIIFDYTLIFVFHFGIKGAALATISAESVSAIWVLIYFSRGKGIIQFKKKNFLLQRDIVTGIFKIGVAPFLMQIGASAVMIVLNFHIMKYGVIAVAAFGIINRILMLVMMPIVGISQGAQPIIGYNYGCKSFDRVILTLKKASFIATALCLCGFLCVELFAEQLVLMFNDDPQLVVIGAKGMRVFLLFLPAIGLQIIGANYFQAIGRAFPSIILSLLRQVILLIPLVFILSHLFGLTGIWAAGPISDVIAAILTVTFLLKSIKGFKKCF
jgi:putative MATE family efflux protein